jgi:hypothetical protein
MEKIYCVEKGFEDSFEFDKLSLAQPNALQGGSYFTKLLNNNNPLRIQLNQCSTKQGIVKTDKKLYCDLMFKNDDNSFIKWLEKFEQKCHQLIFDKKHLWFHTDFDFSDLENTFTSPMRIYRSGSFVLVRVYIQNSKLIKKNNSCLVYDENETLLSLDDMKVTNNIIPLITIEGIRFSSRSFQIDITLNQVMVLKDVPDLNSHCAIKINNPFENRINLERKGDNTIPKKENNTNNDAEGEEVGEEAAEEAEGEEVREEEAEEVREEVREEEAEAEAEEVREEVREEEAGGEEVRKEEAIEEETGGEEVREEEAGGERSDQTIIKESEDEKKDENINEKQEIINGGEADKNEKISKPLEDLTEKLEEVTLDLNNNLETIKLKKPNEVYYAIYRAAREKAKNARKLAVEAHLEAKKIKTAYMLDEIDESEDESILDSDEESVILDLG